MKLYTIQMSSWRKALALEIPFYDVTVKSGDKLFAPTWDILMKSKTNQDKESREKEYTEAFHKHMQLSYKDNKQHWVDLLSKESLAIACFCSGKEGTFCHRHILVDYFDKVCKIHGIEFEYLGEIR